MLYRMIIGIVILIFSFATVAETPNVEPGEWEFTNVTTFEGDMSIPKQRHTDRECITQEDVDRGFAYLDDEQEQMCEIVSRDVSSSSMTTEMTCTDPEGNDFTMHQEMTFSGDYIEGLMTGDMDTPMGAMTMRMTTNGERVGDC